MSNDALTPPSHLTLIQASRVLKRSKSTIHFWMRPGGPLEAETWHGVRMVAMRRVLAKMNETAPAPQEAEPKAGEEEGWDL